jgi:hypothetical protein
MEGQNGAPETDVSRHEEITDQRKIGGYRLKKGDVGICIKVPLPTLNLITEGRK